MAKSKRRFEGTIQLLSNLPLEECVSRLQALEDETLKVIFFRDGHDSVLFIAHILERGIVRPEAMGHLRRWEGTLTRVDCDVKVREGIMRWLMLLLMLFLLTMVAVPLLFFLAAGIDMLLWLVISLVFIIAFTGLIFITNHFAPIDDTPQNLLHLITSTLED